MIRILHAACRSCDVCVAVCPQLALWMHGDRLVHRAERCTGEGACIAVCPASALVWETSRESEGRAAGPARGPGRGGDDAR